MESRKSRAGRDRPFCHTQPPSLSLTALIHATAVTLASVPTQHPLDTLLFSIPPPQDLPPHFFRTFLKRCNSLYGLPLQTTLCKMVLPSTFRLLQNSRLLLCFAPYNQIHISLFAHCLSPTTTK